MFAVRKRFKHRFRLLSVGLGLLIISSLAGFFFSPLPAFAEACSGSPCFQGIDIYQPNRGVGAQIYTTTPNYINGANLTSYILINSQTPANQGTQVFIQTGWAYYSFASGNNCGTSMKFFWEFIDYSVGQYINHCENVYPAAFSTHSYTHEYDGNNGYWCHDFDGVCYHSEPAIAPNPQTRATGATVATQVAVYGEVNDSRIQMGGANSANPVTVSAVNYKPNATGSFSAFTVPPYVYNDAYGTCTYASGHACNYAHQSGGDPNNGNRLYVRIWSNLIFS